MVLPLQEDCGILEWVNNTSTLRDCLSGIYAAEGITDRATWSRVKTMWDRHTARPCCELPEAFVALCSPAVV